MAVLDAKPAPAAVRGLPKEFSAAVAVVLGLLAVAGVGTLLSSALPASEATPVMLIGSYLAPAAVLFVVLWLRAQRN